MGWQGNEISVSRCSFSGLFVGADACIGPLGSCEFAVDYRKNGLYCRADATRPQTGFEAQPRIARLLAPKMGIGPYRKWLYHVAQITCPFFNCSWSLSAMSAINSEFVGLPFVFDTV